MKIVDLFSGVGGLSLGFHLAGFESDIAVEYSSNIAAGFAENFPYTKLINEDINDINLSELLAPLNGNNYILIGGPPCQGFSQKGKRLGLNDDRNFMFLKYIEAVEFLKPKAILIENVPGIITAENGYFLKDIESKLSSLGYRVSHKVLDAAEYGVPQTRKRAFIVGIANSNIDFDWPKRNEHKVTVENAISDLPPLNSGEGKQEMPYTSLPQSEYQNAMRKNSEVIYNHISTKHSPLVLKRLSLIPENGGRNDLPIEHLTKSTFSGTWCRLSKTGQARTITTRFDTPSSGMFTLPTQNRCLTVREAARLQSFPDNFKFVGNKSTQMLQVGNAVPPLLSLAIAKQLKKQLS
ncbi:DNA cytosine methyltransferase [Pseudoalteromonas sp. FUC4]|uniref:DNA cytosine methyltransferase n=1 Tax=Pseudoalteromonas sp. FUC4 TaxID=2511201 RepID=UPI0011F3903E|nr:DNA cytosine methyltransferase [Pseudoalteromonas sp. FUC4]KAA1150665.1 DNA cytosine methyltransferase [Pseudoalteromonas sp. FUC4]